RGVDVQAPSSTLFAGAPATRSAATPIVKLLAISDLHVSHRSNREALALLAPHPDDWLIVAGDVSERVEHLRATLDLLTDRFARVFWVPGNHDLWCPPTALDRSRGQARY